MKKNLIYLTSLCFIFAAVTLLCLPDGCIFGSNTDWLSQHVSLAETIRNACVEQKTLLPVSLNLGGGSNAYLFSYYGFLRPDILIGCLFQDIPMRFLLIGYILVSCLFAVLLFFWWIQGETKDRFLSWCASVLFLTAACFFHAHRQIMFINYLPFLLLALLCIQKKKIRFLPLCLFLIYLHSFYFSVSCMVVIAWYWYQKEIYEIRKNGFFRSLFFKSLSGSIVLASAMAAALLLPTALVLLEHRRSLSAAPLLEILAPDFTMSGLLYSPYGMGLTILSLYALLTGLTQKVFFKNSVLYLAVSCWCFIPYLLNLTLYPRTKILIPFVPLILLHTVQILQNLITEQKKTDTSRLTFLFPFPLFIIIACFSWQKERFSFVLLDIGFLFVFLFTVAFARQKLAKYSLLLLLVMPCLLFIQTARTDNFVKKGQTDEAFSVQKTNELKFSPLYRFDTLTEPLTNCNQLPNVRQPKSTMYSSVTNQKYLHVYYDILQTPVQINNKTALLSTDNPFLLHLLGIRYIEATKDTVPAGYKILQTSGEHVIAENEEVLPIGYFTDNCISQEQFQAFSQAEQLEAITKFTVIDTPPEKENIQKQDVTFQRRSFTPLWDSLTLPDSLRLKKTENGILVRASSESTLSLSLLNPAPDQILLLEFQVVNKGSHAVVIDINQIRNKLSGASAPYPNGNDTFHYQLSPNKADTLEITFSKGTYLLKNIQWSTLPKTIFSQKTFLPLKLYSKELPADTNRLFEADTLLSGTIETDTDGYFATSIPLQNGLKILVDGQSVPLLTVNEAFAGTELSKGTHTVQVLFYPPGRTAGCLLSITALIFYLFLFIRWNMQERNTL